MKTCFPFIATVLLAGTAAAGDVTIYNDQGFPRLIRLGHKGQKLYKGWILSNQRITVHVDENRKGKPILLVDTREMSSTGNRPKFSFKGYPLAKKAEPLFYNMSWFPRGY
jgi:hypothetical protein